MIRWLKSLFRTADPLGQLPMWNGPASPGAIAAAELKLGVTLPEELRALYLRHDGVHERNAANLKYRLMPLKEAVRTHRDISKAFARSALLKKYSMRCFFSGEDFAGVYCAEPFTGYLFFLHHESMYFGDESPLFSSIESFDGRCRELEEREAIRMAFSEGVLSEEEARANLLARRGELLFPDEGPGAAAGMPVDFPAVRATVKSTVAYEECRRRLDSGDFESVAEFYLLVCSAARMVPPDRILECEKFLIEDDYFVPGKVASILAARDHPLVFDMFVRGARLDPEGEIDRLDFLLARMALRGINTKNAILAAYEKQDANSSEFLEYCEELNAKPPINF
ncbi:MAG: hypothetical protein ACJASX_000799 [Limisphaerales bacterium]|jgi:hypothetical protein